MTGKQPATWGATMALSKSDGSYVIVANNTLSWWDYKTGRDTVPRPEKWTIRLAKESLFSITDVLTGAIMGPFKGNTIELSVRGYPMLVHVQPGNGPTRIE